MSKNKQVCIGPSHWPATFEELEDIFDKISDHWDQQIACVASGIKKVAMTDYEQFQEDSDVPSYYMELPMNVELRNDAKKKGVVISHDKEGTMFWYYPKHAKEARILINHYNGVKDFNMREIDFTITQGLLLGYTTQSILLYEIYDIAQRYKNEENEYYQQLVKDKTFIREYRNKIFDCKYWIADRMRMLKKTGWCD